MVGIAALWLDGCVWDGEAGAAAAARACESAVCSGGHGRRAAAAAQGAPVHHLAPVLAACLPGEVGPWFVIHQLSPLLDIRMWNYRSIAIAHSHWLLFLCECSPFSSM